MLGTAGANRFLQNCFDQWINPEVERRKQSGEIAPDFILNAAEVVMFGNARPLTVRFNGELKSTAEIFVPDATPGVHNRSYQGQVLKITPSLDEVNCAHVILLRQGDGWAIAFDFTYNSGHVAECFRGALEFYDSALHSFESKRYRPCVDNLFSSIELLGKCLLQMTPGETKFSHQFIHQEINLRKRDNVVGGDLAPLLNQLAAERTKARYQTSEYRPLASDLNYWLTEVSKALEFCRSQISTRSRVLLDKGSLGVAPQNADD